MSTRDGEPGRLAMPRRRGAASGLLIVILGALAALIPFVGPYFDVVIGPDEAWDMTAGRFWLSLIPGIVAVVGGLMLMRAGNRATGTLGSQLALAAGIWLIVGPTVSMLWNDGVSQAGDAFGTTEQEVLAWLLFFYGTGAAITALAGIALGRVSARHAGDLERLAPAAEHREPTGRFSREKAEEPEHATTAPPPRA